MSLLLVYRLVVHDLSVDALSAVSQFPVKIILQGDRGPSEGAFSKLVHRKCRCNLNLNLMNHPGMEACTCFSHRRLAEVEVHFIKLLVDKTGANQAYSM